MKRMSQVNVMEYAKITAVTGLILGLLFGIFGFIGVSFASGVVDWSMNGVFAFLNFKEKSATGIDNEAFASMANDIAKGISKMNGMSEADFNKMYPEGAETSVVTNNIKEKVMGFFSGLMGQLKWVMLIGLPIKGLIMGFIIGLIGAFVYNKLNGMEVEV